MGLGRLKLSAINKNKVWRGLRKPAFNENASIHGFDTETRPDGQIYLLSYCFDGMAPAYIGHADFSPLDRTEIFDILIQSRTRRPATNVWFNLDFDANALFGTILTETQMQELADTNETSFRYNDQQYQLTYIKGKFLSIKDEHRHTSTHYDISQFFYSNLETAAINWLGMDKGDIDFDNINSYSWNEITDYAKQDAKLTRKLWKLFVDLGENELNIPFGKPISTGFVAQQVCFDTIPVKPAFGTKHYQTLATKAYHGGRFEVFRRGYFPNVIGLDINSAYPYHMAQMPTLDDCDISVTGANLSDLKRADWGFVTFTGTTDSKRNIQPFAVKDKQVTFPALESYQLTTTIDEFLFAYENDYLEDFTIQKAALAYEKENARRPFSFLTDWYDRRLNHKAKSTEKNDKHDKFQFILKVIMNSVYGKTCQVTEKHEYLDDKEDFIANPTEFLTEGYTGKPIKGWFEAGDLFNPFYASYITAKTRLQLHKAAVDLGLEDSCIMFATDCLMIEADDITRTQIDKLLNPKELGAWDFDYKGSAFVVGSGVYDVMESGQLQKMAKRGFKEVTKSYDSWRQAAQNANGKIVLENERPARFKEWLLHDGHPRPSQFFDDKRELSPDFDTKRGWHSQATFDKLLSDNHGSEPLTISA